MNPTRKWIQYQNVIAALLGAGAMLFVLYGVTAVTFVSNETLIVASIFLFASGIGLYVLTEGLCDEADRMLQAKMHGQRLMGFLSGFAVAHNGLTADARKVSISMTNSLIFMCEGRGGAQQAIFEWQTTHLKSANGKPLELTAGETSTALSALQAVYIQHMLELR